MNKGVKFRIYPNRKQIKLINQTLGCCRLIYNKGLAMRKDSFEKGSKIGYKETSAMLTDLKAFSNSGDAKISLYLCLLFDDLELPKSVL